MIDLLLHSIVDFTGLAAFSSFIGAFWLLLWLRSFDKGEADTGIFTDRLWRLIALCLTTLALTGIGDLIQRGMEMSGSGIPAVFPVLPTVVFRTHYGSMWLMRMGVVFAAWMGLWAGSRNKRSFFLLLFMFGFGIAVAFSHSASGHAADFGDGSMQQVSDFLHLLAAASWGGSFLALVAVVRSSAEAGGTGQRVAAALADRFYAFFGPVLAVLVFTGLYNAWVEAGNFGVLVTTAYGRILSVKILLLLLLSFRYVAIPEHGRDEKAYAERFLGRLKKEAIIVSALLLCAALLIHSIPARHASHTAAGHSHGMGKGM